MLTAQCRASTGVFPLSLGFKGFDHFAPHVAPQAGCDEPLVPLSTRIQSHLPRAWPRPQPLTALRHMALRLLFAGRHLLPQVPGVGSRVRPAWFGLLGSFKPTLKPERAVEVLWHFGTLVLWYFGTLALWHPGQRSAIFADCLRAARPERGRP